MHFNEPDDQRWPMFFHVGTDWLMTWQVLTDLRRDGKNAGLVPSPFYVDNYIVHFCLELFTKSLVDYSVPGFNPKEFSHRTLQYIQKYEFVSPIFAKVTSDADLCALIREYQNTVDTRFGETYVLGEKSDVDKMMSLVYEIRAEICTKTGLR